MKNLYLPAHDFTPSSVVIKLCYFILLKTKRRLLYLKTQSVPRC